MKNYKDKNVLITGGSSGIGFALAEQMVLAEANVWILARREEVLKDSLAQLEIKKISENQKIAMIVADVSNFSILKPQLDKVFNDNMYPEILFNCAGVVHPGEFLEMDIEDYLSDISIDYMGTVNTTKIIAPLMAKNRRGHIVNISSLAGLVSVYGYSAYSPAKAAVKSFTAALRSELYPYNIQVSIVYPADTETPQLTYDNEHKPAITKEISEAWGLYTAEQTAQGIIKGMEKGKYAIMPSLTTRLLKPFAATIEVIMHRIALSKIKKSK